ncbi:MAG TPA: sigma-70 family RNA polymerase sigma factor [Gemmatimonadales bacterium]|jgi:RNA polymerase sigma-70 factor (ECF subfamily)|nr:sigma-70 family RNA polymerase sigma factor [Gemmatimonadales bacterium]
MFSQAAASPASADGDLIVQVAGGDERAIATLYERYGGVLYAVAYRIVGQRADAEEVVIEAFAQAWREAPRFASERGSVAGWLTMIARSRALDTVRARSRRDRLTASAAADRTGLSPAMGAWHSDPAGVVDHAERRAKVREALESLSPPQRQAIELAYFEGLSQSEIAERLQEPLGTIKTRVRLAMQKLRESLRPFYFERGT